MTYISTLADRQRLIYDITQQEMPFTYSIVKGEKRNWKQNRVAMLWVKHASEQLEGHTFSELRAYCKLHFGVPILRRDDVEFLDGYDRIIRPLTYEIKMEAMVEAWGYPVTRRMNKEQMNEYIKEIERFFSEQGVFIPVQTEER